MTSIALVFLGLWLVVGGFRLSLAGCLPCSRTHLVLRVTCVSAPRPPLLTFSHSPGCASALLCPPPSFSVNSLFGFHWVSPSSCHQLGLQLPFLLWALNFLQSQFTADLKDLKSGMARPCWLLPPPSPPAKLWGGRRPETMADRHVPGLRPQTTCLTRTDGKEVLSPLPGDFLCFY